ncbi:MAG: sodium:solute symporter family transporter, partial [Spirochaetota bacterium]
SVQLIGAGLLVSGLTGGSVPFFIGVLIMAVLSGVTAIWAGMRSVSWTDAFQAMTMIVTSVVAVLFILFRFFGSPGEFFATITVSRPDLLEFTWSPALFIGLTLPWAFFALTNPQVSQRLFIRMVLYFAAFGLLYTIISTLFGFAAAEIVPGLENPDAAMPALLAQLPSALAVIIFIGIFAAASSTLGSIILTLSSLFTRDVVRMLRPEISERDEQRLAYLAIVVLLLLCMGFASLQLGLIAARDGACDHRGVLLEAFDRRRCAGLDGRRGSRHRRPVRERVLPARLVACGLGRRPDDHPLRRGEPLHSGADRWCEVHRRGERGDAFAGAAPVSGFFYRCAARGSIRY